MHCALGFIGIIFLSHKKMFIGEVLKFLSSWGLLNILDILNGRVLPMSGAIICEPMSLCISGISLQYSTYKMEESLLP